MEEVAQAIAVHGGGLDVNASPSDSNEVVILSSTAPNLVAVSASVVVSKSDTALASNLTSAVASVALLNPNADPTPNPVPAVASIVVSKANSR